MKIKKISCWVVIAALLLTMVSCAKYDISPISIKIVVTNADNQNLLEETAAGSWYGKEISCTLNDSESYSLAWPITKAVNVDFSGLTLSRLEGNEMALRFGAFPGDETFSHTIRFLWPDGSTNVITIDNQFSYHMGRPKIKSSYLVDGQKQSSSIIRLKKLL